MNQGSRFRIIAFIHQTPPGAHGWENKRRSHPQFTRFVHLSLWYAPSSWRSISKRWVTNKLDKLHFYEIQTPSIYLSSWTERACCVAITPTGSTEYQISDDSNKKNAGPNKLAVQCFDEAASGRIYSRGGTFFMHLHADILMSSCRSSIPKTSGQKILKKTTKNNLNII